MLSSVSLSSPAHRVTAPCVSARNPPQALFHYSFVARKLGCPLDNKLHFVDCVSNLLATSDADDVVIASPATKRKGTAGPVMHRYKLGNADAPLVRAMRLKWCLPHG